MAYQTENELLERYEYYTHKIEERLMEDEDFETVSNQIPIIAHLSDPKTFEIVEANEKYIHSSGYEVAEVQANWLEYVMNTIHPESAKSILSFYRLFFKPRIQTRQQVL